MSGLGAQDALVAVLAAGALAWLVRRRLRRRGGAACENCPAAGARTTPGSDFVPLGELGTGPAREARPPR